MIYDYTISLEKNVFQKINIYNQKYHLNQKTLMITTFYRKVGVGDKFH
jgi:hypothetical protein